MTIVKVDHRNVPNIRGDKGADGGKIASSANVLGSTWQGAADVLNTLHARGGQLVLATAINESIAESATATLRFYAWPRLAARHRVWIVYATGEGADHGAITLDEGTESASTHHVDAFSLAAGLQWNASQDPPDPAIHVSTITPTNTPGEISLSVTAVGSDIVVYSVACFDLPRTRLLLGGTDDVAAFVIPGAPIYQAAQTALRGIATSADNGRAKLRRKLLDWRNATGFTTTSGSFTAVFQLAPTVLGRGGSSVDGATVTVAVAARLASTAGNGELKITMASGGTVTLTCTSATPAWYTGTVAIDREDLTDADSGGQVGRLFGDAVTVEARKTTGTNITITGLAMSEAL